MLRLIADQVRYRETVHETWGFRRKESRGLGITALFVGESGTGKTWRPRSWPTSCAWISIASTSPRW